MRSPTTIRDEIDALSARRAGLWALLGTGDGRVRDEVEALNEDIGRLWLELRRLQAELRSGPHAAIMARARREERAEQELRRAAKRTA